MKHLIPFIGGVLGAVVGVVGFPNSAPDNRILFPLLSGGGVFLLLGVIVWVLPAIPPPTEGELQYSAWVASWTPPQPVYREDPYVQHQRHLQDQARMGWLMGDRDYPPTDWFGG